MEDLKLFKLVDGSFVVGSQNFSQINNTLKVNIMEDDEGFGITLTSLLYPFEENRQGCTISTGHVIVSMDCPADLKDVYNQEYSGIIPATQLP